MPKTSNDAYLGSAFDGTQAGRAGVNAFSRAEAMRSLGPVVYALRLDGGIIKIGFTTDLYGRQKTLAYRSQSVEREILAFKSGTEQDEQAIHGLLDGHQARGREYYHPTRRVLEVVNQMRERLGLEPIAA